VNGPGAAEIRVVSNGELRAGTSGADDPALVGMTAARRAAILANPLLGPDGDPARIVAFLDGQVVGRLDLLAGEISTPSGPVPVFWGSAFYVSPEARGRGIGGELLRTAEELREGAGACAPSRLSHPIYARRGYFDLPLRRHVLVRRTTPLAEGWLGKGRIAGAAGTLGDTALRAQRAASGARSTGQRGVQLELRDAFPGELEPRLHERRGPFAMHRSAAWVDWILRESFGDPSHRRGLYLARSAGGEVLGYALLKARLYSGVTRWRLENLRLGSLVDWQIFEPASLSFQQLLRLVIEALEEWKVDAVEACLPPGYERGRLRRLGFFTLGVQHLVLRGWAGSALAGGDAQDPARWSVRPGEGDHAFS
jgi:GNAT superfamily N-acetyltransferase